MKLLNCLFLTIGTVGAINWGLIGLFDFNLVTFLFGFNSLAERGVYVLVGLSGLYMLMFYPRVMSPYDKTYK